MARHPWLRLNPSSQIVSPVTHVISHYLYTVYLQSSMAATTKYILITRNPFNSVILHKFQSGFENEQTYSLYYLIILK